MIHNQDFRSPTFTLKLPRPHRRAARLGMSSKLNPRLPHVNHQDIYQSITPLPTALPLPPFIPTTFMTFPSIDFATPNIPQEYGPPIDIYLVSCGRVLLFTLCCSHDGLGSHITTLTIPYDDCCYCRSKFLLEGCHHSTSRTDEGDI